MEAKIAPSAKNTAQTDIIWELLQKVKDPEIPTVSVVDLGVIQTVEYLADGGLRVVMVPTFSACPAAKFMQWEVENVLRSAGYSPFTVELDYTRKWSSNDLTERGRAALLEFGLSPPPRFSGELGMEMLEKAVCPKCLSEDTYLMTPFGPTLCRAIHHCNACGETFEQFKPL